ncbi:MAG: hypothetical protein NVSMB56_13360 [Pyrinomonadaceae bacterium]
MIDKSAEDKKDEKQESDQPPAGMHREPAIERYLSNYLGNGIHLFLVILSVLIMGAALVATYDTVVRDFPKLLKPSNEYEELSGIIQNILLIAIAAELGLLFLFHRSSAAIEIIIFVVARKIVNPKISAIDLLLSVAALAILLVVRFYYLPGKPK